VKSGVKRRREKSVCVCCRPEGLKIPAEHVFMCVCGLYTAGALGGGSESVHTDRGSNVLHVEWTPAGCWESVQCGSAGCDSVCVAKQ
jgi:hypothetical protein